MIRTSILAAALACAAFPAAAQTAAPVAPNAAVAAQMNAEAQAQYDADIAAYESAVRANRRQNMADTDHYAHQRAAYAEAMRAWRQQVRDCKRGINAACRAPTPDPAAFW